MAHMIPAVVPPKTPYSERRIFERLQRDPDTKDWIVLHSLGLSRTGIGPHGEVDLVVLVPTVGVLCIEVKGGIVSCNGGKWKTKNTRTGKISVLDKSPYLQARENMFALMRRVAEHFKEDPNIKKALYSYAVVFPDVEGPPDTPETEEWETFDIHSLRKPISSLVLHNLKRMKVKLGKGVPGDSVSIQAMGSLRKFLRPDFERLIVRSATIAQSEEQLISLTEEQYNYLDVAGANERAVITGAAGTGKTVLALEYARRESVNGQVLLICYNKMLANWLSDVVREEDLSSVTVSTFHAYIKSIVEKSFLRQEYEDATKGKDYSEIFREICPLYAELAISESGEAFDTLIVDEAQDLMNTADLAVFNVMVRGGLAGGRWALFGDFERQAIYGGGAVSGGEEEALQLLSTFSRRFSIVPLRLNCRNTRQIGEETALLSGFDSLPYNLGKVDGLAVDYRYWKNDSEQVSQLVRVIKKLIEEGVNISEMVILGPVRLENSIVPKVSSELQIPVVSPGEGLAVADNVLYYSTIHAFKGMESPVVIIAGITDIESETQCSLLYVGMSRARSHLIVLLKDSVKRLIPELTKKKLNKDWRR